MRAEAIAEEGGKIVAVGSKADVMKLKGPKTEVIDLKGRTLLPGFVDAHGHMVVGGLQATKVPLFFAAFGYWVVGIGVGAWLAFRTGWEGVGVWTGLATGLAIVSVLMLIRWSMRERLGLLPSKG